MSTCAVLFASVAAGCAGGQGETSADCAAAIRRDGTVYLEAGFTKHPAVASGQAERADCHDAGQVLGVREGKQIRVFIAEGVAAEPVMNKMERAGDE